MQCPTLPMKLPNLDLGTNTSTSKTRNDGIQRLVNLTFRDNIGDKRPVGLPSISPPSNKSLTIKGKAGCSHSTRSTTVRLFFSDSYRIHRCAYYLLLEIDGLTPLTPKSCLENEVLEN